MNENILHYKRKYVALKWIVVSFAIATFMVYEMLSF